MSAKADQTSKMVMQINKRWCLLIKKISSYWDYKRLLRSLVKNKSLFNVYPYGLMTEWCYKKKFNLTKKEATVR